MGDWTEAGENVIRTLNADGTLREHVDDSEWSGTWSFRPWAQTPAKKFMPEGQGNQCVLLLHWDQPGPPIDFAYFPVRVTRDLLQLSYIGRGNTIIWNRPRADT